MKTLFIPIILIVIACQEPFDEGNGEIPAILIENTKNLFPGIVGEISAEKLNGVNVWKIPVENENGSVVVFYWRRALNNLYIIKGTTGPFDYGLKPPFDVLNFSTVRFLATSNYMIGTISSWSFEPSTTQNMKWNYKFTGDGTGSPLLLEAGSGAIIR